MGEMGSSERIKHLEGHLVRGDRLERLLELTERVAERVVRRGRVGHQLEGDAEASLRCAQVAFARAGGGRERGREGRGGDREG